MGAREWERQVVETVVDSNLESTLELLRVKKGVILTDSQISAIREAYVASTLAGVPFYRASEMERARDRRARKRELRSVLEGIVGHYGSTRGD